jgi:hypothetical protein
MRLIFGAAIISASCGVRLIALELEAGRHDRRLALVLRAFQGAQRPAHEILVLLRELGVARDLPEPGGMLSFAPSPPGAAPTRGPVVISLPIDAQRRQAAHRVLQVRPAELDDVPGGDELLGALLGLVCPTDDLAAVSRGRLHVRRPEPVELLRRAAVPAADLAQKALAPHRRRGVVYASSSVPVMSTGFAWSSRNCRSSPSGDGSSSAGIRSRPCLT